MLTVKVTWSMAVSAKAMGELAVQIQRHVDRDAVLSAHFTSQSVTLAVPSHEDASAVVRAVGKWVGEWPKLGMSRQSINIQIRGQADA